MKRDELLTILNVIADPVLLVSTERTVLLANDAAEQQLGMDISGRDFVRAIRHPDALACVETALSGDAAGEAVISLGEPATRTYRMRAQPFHSREDMGKGALVSLGDITPILEAEQMRSDFVANVSHELRSPLTALTGGIETLLGAAKDDPEARERFLGIMQREAARMDRLVGDLLSLSQVEVDEHVRPSGTVDVGQIVERVVAAMKTGADAGPKRIRYEAPQHPARVPGDADQLTEVFNNLVENALKYSGEESPVEISVTHHERARGIAGPAVAFAVKDQGEGIPAELIPRLTERFYRVDKSRSRQKGGTGLGLAIVKHIVNRHRGRLQIDSTPGKGSTFTVFMPVDWSH